MHDLDQMPAPFLGWAPLFGLWELGHHAQYHPPAAESESAAGIVLSPELLNAGRIWTRVLFDAGDEPKPQARIVFGFDSETQAFFSAGLGGYNALYVIEQLIPGRGFVPLRTLGLPENLHRDEQYELSVAVAGQWVSLAVDGVVVMEVALPSPPLGIQTGLTAWGRSSVTFTDFGVEARRPSAFVVMQFGDQFDALYRDVIAPVCAEQGFDATRADDVFGPGVILDDITEGIREATVVIAEITPVNANVYYELGFAHATGKPSVLLAAKGQPLPFDVQGFRCIFYDDTIAGKGRVEADLRRHLSAIRQSPLTG